MESLALALWGTLALSVAMVCAWLCQLRTRNAGIVDVLWAAGLGALGLLYAVSAEGWLPRRILVLALIVGWSLRLSAHLARRVGSEGEDGRYARLRHRLGARADAWFFVFFQAQALLAGSLSLAFLIPCQAAQAGWRVWDALALALWLVAILGESAADRELAAWRAAPENRGRTCRAGLWRYSRHPNYFFEWLHWLAYPLCALGLPWGWATWFAPLALLALVLKVTGIPPTEAQALASRGDDYRAYQASTNAFFPGPPRRAHPLPG